MGKPVKYNDDIEPPDDDEIYIDLVVVSAMAVKAYEAFLKGSNGSSLTLARAMKELRDRLPNDIDDLMDD